MEEKMIYDMAVIGGGPGGCTAALYAVRAGLRTVMLEKLHAGGQMALAHQMDNYPGFETGIDGFTLGEKMRAQAERFGAETVTAKVLRVDLRAEPKHLETSAGTIYARTVVLATGAGPRELGLPMERELVGRGISYCASCDGMFYRGKTVVVVGGGNSAAEDALMLSRVAERVLLVHRRDTLRAEKVYCEGLKQRKNVEFLWNHVVTELKYGEQVTGVRLRNTVTGAETERSCDGVFISVGRIPASELAAGQLARDPGGYFIAGEDTQTEIPGVYAVGDVRTRLLRQVVTAVADGAVAGSLAGQYLDGREVGPDSVTSRENMKTKKNPEA